MNRSGRSLISPRRGSVLAALLAACIGPLSATPAVADVAGQSRDAVVAQFQSVLLPALAVPNEWTGSIAGCSSGSSSPAYQQATLAAVNYVRGLVSLPAVSLDPGMNADAQAAALIMAAQGDLSHFPPSTWNCWSQQGAAGAGRSNLYLGRSGARSIVGYMDDPGANNLLVGHRRWILDSGATLIGTGDTANTNALAVIGAPRRTSPQAWIPWPAPGYFPWQMEPEGRWSLGRPEADFTGASVSVTIGGSAIPVTVTPPVDGYGDNTISWDMQLPPTVRQQHPEDMNVDVAVDGIRLPDGSTTSYRYAVSLISAAPKTIPASTWFESVRRARTTLVARWAATADDGGEAVTYVVTARPVGRAARKLPVRTCTTAATSCTLHGISRNARYDVSVVVGNSVGQSPVGLGIVRRA